MPPKKSNSSVPADRSQAPFPTRWQRWREQASLFHWRDHWWNFLDRWESNQSFRRWSYSGLATILVLASLAHWAYPWWTQRNSVRLAQQWLITGHYQYAAEAIREAMFIAPGNPQTWRIAAELAEIGGKKSLAVEYARRAANLPPKNLERSLAWSAAALRADQVSTAELALSTISIEKLNASAHAQRLLGEIARRQVRLTAAKNHFAAARAIDGPVAINEVPLGVILLNAVAPAERQQGFHLLTKWISNREWGAVALRGLLKDALDHNELAPLRQWADALRVHPNCTLSDMPDCLRALARADQQHYAQVLAAMEKDHAATPEAATQLLSWLNQIGRSADAVKWMQTLPPAAMQRPPLAVAAAEALRQTGDWPALQAWTHQKNWGPEADFLRWAYGLQAAHQLNDNKIAEELWRTLESHAQINSTHALFAAATIYSWGRTTEAEALWWQAATHDGQIAIDALGSLARHYQTQRDADGQYRVFRQLHALRPHDADIGNNFAFFATLTGREQRQTQQIIQANLALAPQQPTYLATAAFMLFMQNRSAESLALLQPHVAEVPTSLPLKFAYGLALAGTGEKITARTFLDTLPPASLTEREVEIIKAALAPR
ncbi:MAG: hypothetical protein EBT89_07140 [Opitutaceae bacterium]|nr:hypothetical protein [Opitutaceae bacterium]